MPTLNGARIALLEARMTGEASDLVRRLGGVPYAVPALREMARLEAIPAFLDALAAGRFSIVIFLTGVGVTTLLREAERLGRLEETIVALRNTTTACRGPKPSGALRRVGVPVTLSAVEPYTTRELLDAMSELTLEAQSVALVHYGERHDALADALKERGARLEELCPYEWLMPLDIEPLATLVGELIDRRVGAVAFTSQVQWRHLLQVASDRGCASELIEVLNQHTIVAAIGPVCAEALREGGVVPDVVPAHPKLGALILALAEYFELTDETPS